MGHFKNIDIELVNLVCECDDWMNFYDCIKEKFKDWSHEEIQEIVERFDEYKERSEEMLNV